MEVGQATLHEEDTDIRHFFEDCFQVRTYVYTYVQVHVVVYYCISVHRCTYNQCNHAEHAYSYIHDLTAAHSKTSRSDNRSLHTP
jgi:hypothetical protein